jgi:hypothetical protein
MFDRKLLLLLFIAVCLVSAASASQRGAKPSPPKGGAAAPELSDQDKQQQTIRDMRNAGTAMFSWLTDQVGASAAGAKPIDLNQYPAISFQELEKILVPDYLVALPKVDGWGHPYEYRLNVENPAAETVMSIRSPGRDGVFSGDVYKDLKYPPKDLDQDIVWADGFFADWDDPAKGQTTR